MLGWEGGLKLENWSNLDLYEPINEHVAVMRQDVRGLAGAFQ